MSAQAGDVLYTVALVTVGLILLVVLINVVKVLLGRVRADHDAVTFGDDWLTGRDMHDADVRAALLARRAS